MRHDFFRQKYLFYYTVQSKPCYNINLYDQLYMSIMIFSIFKTCMENTLKFSFSSNLHFTDFTFNTMDFTVFRINIFGRQLTNTKTSWLPPRGVALHHQMRYLESTSEVFVRTERKIFSAKTPTVFPQHYFRFYYHQKVCQVC